MPRVELGFFIVQGYISGMLCYKNKKLYMVAAGIMVVLAGCATEEIISEQYEPDASYEEYVRAMHELGMSNSRIGAAWVASGELEGAEPVIAATPFQERRFLDPREPQAVFYLVEGMRGHRLDIAVNGPSGSAYFLDAYRLPAEYRPRIDSGQGNWQDVPWQRGEAEQAASAGGVQHGESELSFEPRQHRFYLIRLQPQLLEGGEFTIRITADAALAWPVPGTSHEDIWSVFGAPRDGGVRIHHGVDIFAPRHTPLVTISEESYIRTVGQRDRGGNTVSITDRQRDLMLYYAHLEDQEHDIEGQTVPSGTRVGTMGNTGNAMTTPPHLHIGIYEGSWRRPLDPWYFIVPLNTDPPGIAELPAALGEYARIVPASADIIAYPAQTSSTLPSPAVTDGRGDGLPESAYPVTSFPAGPALAARLANGTPVRLTGVLGGYAHVTVPDGIRGYLPVQALGSLQQTGERTIEQETMITERVGGSFLPVAVAQAGDVVRDLGGYSSFRLVETSDGQRGWIQ